MKKLFLAILFLPCYISNSIALLNQEQILKKANLFLKNKNENLILKVNNKKKIPNCYGEVRVTDKYENLKTLEINCIGKKPWKYYLRTNISQNILKKNSSKNIKKRKIAVLVSTKRLKKGHMISSEDLKLKYLSHIGGKNTYNKLPELVGRKLKNSLNDEQIIRERHLVKNWVIQEGQKVKIEHKKGNLTILVDGVALKSGMQGDYLEVKNENSGKIVKGWVKNNEKITIFR